MASKFEQRQHLAALSNRFDKANAAYKAETSRISDDSGISAAYDAANGIFAHGDTMYIAGTRSVRDALQDTMIPFGLTAHTDRFKEAQNALNPQIKRVVGHSLGGSVALELAKKHNLDSETYAAPVVSFEPSAKRHRHEWDPISILDRGASSTPSPSWNPHTYAL